MNPWDVIGWLILAGVGAMAVLFLLALTVAAVSTIRIRLAGKRRKNRMEERNN